MAVTTKPYLVYMSQIAQATHDLYADQLKFALFTSAYVPNFEGDTTYTAINDNEVTGPGYDVGGQDLSGRSTSVDSSLAFLVTSDPLIWTGLTATFRYAVLYNSSKNDGLIGAVDFGEDLSYTDSSFTLDLSDGFVRFARS